MKQIGEHIDWIVRSDEQLSRYLTAARDQAPDGAVRLLAFSLRRRCQRLAQALEAMDPVHLTTLRDIPCDGASEAEAAAALAFDPGTAPQATAAEVIPAALAYAEAVSGAYRRMLAQPLPDGAAESLQGLLALEEKDAARLRAMLKQGYPATRTEIDGHRTASGRG